MNKIKKELSDRVLEEMGEMIEYGSSPLCSILDDEDDDDDDDDD